MDYIVEMVHIRKEFPGIVANDDISFRLKKGQVHALLGENGAGKSTLMSILFGLYQPDQGIIKVGGREVAIANPNVANALGIGMVHQHFKLVHNFTVAENIILGLEPRRGWMVNLKAATKRIRALSERYGLNVDPDAKIEDISVGMQQRVEILKMLYRNADVLIFDEPTSVLTPLEVQELLKIMGNLISEGKSIILITHKLKEIKAIADQCTVIRRGKLIGTVEVADMTPEQLAEMMVGREVNFSVVKAPREPGEVILKVEGLSVLNFRKVRGLKDFSLEIRAGEIMGLAGVDGNGQAELVEALIGLRPVESGRIWLDGEDMTQAAVRYRIRRGMACIPEDRHKHGLILDYSVAENIILKSYDQSPYSRHGLLNVEAIQDYARRVMAEFDVRAGRGEASDARSLSGGNQQKVIVGRELEQHPRFLIAFQPTRGLDVGAIEYIHKRLVEQRDQGKAVLLISLELDEILAVSDRIAVINSGELMGVIPAASTDEQEVGLMMAGMKRGDVA